ncbi:P-loop containing nucleoside triphosphate hydrolase protein [Mycena olivaceomarginata]|nr:P-loop containing nucleoside triphosphate hydrolase protein [Mycena olivaceomarginata]
MSSHKRTIVVLGSRSVGKSSLIRRYCDPERQFVNSYFPTIETTYWKTILKYDCKIIDTAGQVYSVASRRSFDLVSVLYDEIRGLYGSPVPCVIVGCKTDLEKHREVETSETAQLAERRNSAWIETSSKTDTNISTLCACSYTDIRLETRRTRDGVLPSPPP